MRKGWRRAACMHRVHVRRVLVCADGLAARSVVHLWCPRLGGVWDDVVMPAWRAPRVCGPWCAGAVVAHCGGVYERATVWWRAPLQAAATTLRMWCLCRGTVAAPGTR